MTDSAFRVLLVEDNDDHAELIRRTLGEHQRAPQIVHISDGGALSITCIVAEPGTTPTKAPAPT